MDAVHSGAGPQAGRHRGRTMSAPIFNRVDGDSALGQTIKRQRETVGLNRGLAGTIVTGSKPDPVRDDRPTLAEAGIDAAQRLRLLASGWASSLRMADLPAGGRCASAGIWRAWAARTGCARASDDARRSCGGNWAPSARCRLRDGTAGLSGPSIAWRALFPSRLYGYGQSVRRLFMRRLRPASTRTRRGAWLQPRLRGTTSRSC